MASSESNLLLQAPWVKSLVDAQELVNWSDADARESIVIEFEYVGREAVGVARAVTDTLTVTYLCDLFVKEGHRGQGIGTRLMKRVLSDDRVSGTTVVLLTQGAEGFYRKFGFEPRQAMVRRPDAKS